MARRWILALLALGLVSVGCDRNPTFVEPPDRSWVPEPETGGVPVTIDLGDIPDGWSFRVVLQAGLDEPPPQDHDLTSGFVRAGDTATGEIPVGLLLEGRNTIFVGLFAPGDPKPGPGRGDVPADLAYAQRVGSSRFSWEPNVRIDLADRCDPFDSVCLYPFPNDYFTVEDDATDTGRRIHIDPLSTPTNRLDEPVDPTEWNRNDGWSPGQAIQVLVRGLKLQDPNPATTDPYQLRPTPVPGASPQWDQAASLASDASIVILDSATGERVPHWAELNERTGLNLRALLIRPSKNFRSGRHYVVALRNLRDDDDQIIPAGRAFRIYRDRIPTFVPALEERRDHMEKVFYILEKNGVARDDLYLAWDFTVISKRNMSERMIHMRDDAFAQLGDASPSFVVDEWGPKPGDPEVRYRVRGHVEVPVYLTNLGEAAADASTRLYCEDGPGEQRLCEGDELPMQARACETPEGEQRACADGEAPTRLATYQAEFRCTVPKSVQADDGSAVPARPSLYGHGLLGDAGEAWASHVETFADEHNFVFCGADWIGMSESDFATVVTILSDFSLFPSLADRLHQAMLNFLFLGRVMIHPDGLGTHPAFQNDAGESILDGSNLYYDGNSQGAIAGGALAAFAQDYTHAVLGVNGMNYSTLLNRSTDFDDFRTLLNINYPRSRFYPLMFGLAQMLWDRVEANGHANHVTHDTYPNTPPKRLLLHVGFGDFQVSDESAQVQARTIGAHIHRPAFDPAAFQAYSPSGDPRPFWPENPYWDIPAIPPSDPGPPLSYPADQGVPAGDTSDATYRFKGSALVIWDFGNLQSPNLNFPPTTVNPELGPCPAGRGGDPHECPRRDPRARLQKSEFLKPNGTVLDVCGGQACVGAPPSP